MHRGPRLSREIWAILLLALAVLMTLSLVVYHPSDRPPYGAAGSIQQVYGFAGYHLVNFLRQGVGLAAFIVPVFLGLVAYQLFYEAPEVTPVRVGSYAVFVLLIVPMLLSAVFEPDEIWDAGGVIGGFSEGAILMPLFGRIGSYVVSFAVFLLGFVLIWKVSVTDLLKSLMGKAAASEHAEQNLGGERPPVARLFLRGGVVDIKPKPVQEKFDFMEKDSK